MFSGIVEDIGEVTAVESGCDWSRITISAPIVDGSAHGASISVDGVCLTITDAAGSVGGTFTVDVIEETLQRSTLGSLNVGDRVNIERALPADGRLNGHMVTGHVDAVGKVGDITDTLTWSSLYIGVPRELAPYIVEKGSVTIAGVALTITAVSEPDEADAYLCVDLIPETLKLTTLGDIDPGDLVNVEVDVVAKHIERILAVRDADRGNQAAQLDPNATLGGSNVHPLHR